MKEVTAALTEPPDTAPIRSGTKGLLKQGFYQDYNHPDPSIYYIDGEGNAYRYAGRARSPHLPAIPFRWKKMSYQPDWVEKIHSIFERFWLDEIQQINE